MCNLPFIISSNSHKLIYGQYFNNTRGPGIYIANINGIVFLCSVVTISNFRMCFSMLNEIDPLYIQYKCDSIKTINTLTYYRLNVNSLLNTMLCKEYYEFNT